MRPIAQNKRLFQPAQVKGNHLHRWVAILGASMAAIVTAHFTASIWSDYHDTLDQGWLIADRTARVLEEQTTQTFDASRLVTDRVITLAREHGLKYLQTPAGWSELRTLKEIAPKIGSIWVTDARANLIAGSEDPHPKAIDIADREYIQRIRAGAPLAIGALATGRLINVWFFSYNRPITSDGELKGIVQTSMHGEGLQAFYENQMLGPGATISQYRLDGALFMRWPLSSSDSGTTIAGTPLFQDHLSRHQAGRVEISGADGSPLLMAYRHVPGLPVIVTAAISQDHALEPFWRRLHRNAALFTFSLLVIGGFTAWAFLALKRENRLREETAEKEERLRLATEATALAVFEWDASSDRSHWENGRMYEILGRPPGDGYLTRSQFFAQYVHPEDVPAAEGALAQAVMSGNTVRHICRIRRSNDGVLRWVEFIAKVQFAADSTPLKLVGTLADITERKEAETALKEALLRLDAARKAARLGIYDHDLRCGRYEWDERLRNLWGLDANDPVDFQVFFAGLHPDDRAPTQAALDRAFQPDGNGQYAAEYRVKNRRDGGERWIAAAGQVFFENHQPVRIIGSVIDITERRTAEEALAELNAKLEQRIATAAEQLVQLQKTEAIGRLTGGVAHDFNNLLMAVVINLEVLKRRLPPEDGPSSRLIENALAAVQRGTTLTQRMLAFARRQELEPTPVSLPDLVIGMTELLARTIGPQISVDTRFSLGVPKAMVDANQLELAILNLAVNARDAMPEGGMLIIKVDAKVIGREGTLSPGRYVRLRMTDTGTGMDAKTLAKSVEPFFTTKGPGKGTGLGLPMVQGLAEQSGGLFTLQSELGRGTTAEILLPIAEGEVSQDETQMGTVDQYHEEAESAPLSVLVVDDDELVLSSMVAVLDSLGHTPIPAGSGREALDLLYSGITIDLVVTDHAMPGMTGLQLAKAIRMDQPHLPIILATGYAELPKGVDDQFACRLNKPFRPEALAAAISKAAESSYCSFY